MNDWRCHRWLGSRWRRLYQRAMASSQRLCFSAIWFYWYVALYSLMTTRTGLLLQRNSHWLLTQEVDQTTESVPFTVREINSTWLKLYDYLRLADNFPGVDYKFPHGMMPPSFPILDQSVIKHVYPMRYFWLEILARLWISLEISWVWSSRSHLRLDLPLLSITAIPIDEWLPYWSQW